MHLFLSPWRIDETNSSTDLRVASAFTKLKNDTKKTGSKDNPRSSFYVAVESIKKFRSISENVYGKVDLFFFSIG